MKHFFKTTGIPIVALAIYIGALVTAVYLTQASPSTVLRIFGVTAYDQPFCDLSVIADGIAANTQTNSPYGNRDINGDFARYNYPRLWLHLKWLGLSLDTVYVWGLALAAIFWTAVLASVRVKTTGQAAYLAMMLCSPVSMMLLERGNNDSVIFLFLTIAAAIPSSIAALGVLFLAAMAKFYPVLTAVGFASQSRQGLARAGLVLIAFCSYVFVIRDDLPLISTFTPRETYQSFGAAIPVQLIFAKLNWSHIGYFNMHLIGCALAMVGALLTCWWLPGVPQPESPRKLRLFLLGGGAFLGGFLVGNSFQYRIVFLLLCLPALWDWAKSASLPVQQLTRTVLILLPIYAWIDVYAGEPMARSTLIKQAMIWTVFSGIAGLWIRLIAQTFTREQREPAPIEYAGAAPTRIT